MTVPFKTTKAMSNCRIFTVSDYQELDAINLAVRDALQSDPAIAHMLRGGDPSRLVVVKPNWVQESHGNKPDVWEPVITHPSVVLAVIEGLADSMSGRGTICLCDAPHTYASFEAIVARGGLRQRLNAVRARWPALDLELTDLRREVWICKEEVVVRRRTNPFDPRGYARLDLGQESLFCGHRGEGKYYGADYDVQTVNKHHRKELHEYLLAGTPVACDLFVNVPKMKTHKKTGITCCLKNLVGINGDKNWLPHHTEGGPRSGGDEFPQEHLSQRIERGLKWFGRRMMARAPGVGSWLYRKLRNTGKRVLGDSQTVIRNGNWCGNDTCWRMALDLNRALLYGNADGTWREAVSAKHYLAIVDGIVGGQGNGPLCPDPVASGVVLSGTNPAHVDAAVCRLMGFDPESLPIVARAFDPHRWPIADVSLKAVEVHDDRLGRTVALDELEPAVPGGFEPHFGWKNLPRSARGNESGKALSRAADLVTEHGGGFGGAAR